ncbi:type I-F CRISPR-associated protein Csy1, partial [Vibrio parahaemolyticus]
LHRLFKTDYNNINIRDGRDYRIQEYVDLVIHRMWQVRLFLADYQGDLSSDLKPEQKFWLYPEYEQYRLEENEWLEGIIRQISRSLIFNYSKVTNNSTALADDE